MNMSTNAAMVSIADLIESRDAYRQGAPCVAGTGVTVASIGLLWLEGLTASEIGTEYPALRPEQVHAALAFYLCNRAAIDQELQREGAAYDAAAEEQRVARQGGATLG